MHFTHTRGSRLQSKEGVSELLLALMPRMSGWLDNAIRSEA